MVVLNLKTVSRYFLSAYHHINISYSADSGPGS